MSNETTIPHTLPCGTVIDFEITLERDHASGGPVVWVKYEAGEDFNALSADQAYPTEEIASWLEVELGYEVDLGSGAFDYSGDGEEVEEGWRVDRA